MTFESNPTANYPHGRGVLNASNVPTTTVKGSGQPIYLRRGHKDEGLALAPPYPHEADPALVPSRELALREANPKYSEHFVKEQANSFILYTIQRLYRLACLNQINGRERRNQ